jgi:YggT family protein
LTGADILATFIDILTWVFIIAIIVRALMSWFPGTQGSSLARLLDDVTEPVLRPIRRVLPPAGGMDFSPIIALVLIYGIRYLALALLSGH